MQLIANFVVLIVALIHLYILILEMFLWNKPRGLRTFGLSQEFANATKTIGANQGLYNGFLAAGLLYGLIQGEAGFQFKLFFLFCILVAGLYGAATFSRKTLYVQAAPAAIGLILLILAR